MIAHKASGDDPADHIRSLQADHLEHQVPVIDQEQVPGTNDAGELTICGGHPLGAALHILGGEDYPLSGLP